MVFWGNRVGGKKEVLFKTSSMTLTTEKEKGSRSPELKYHAHLRGERVAVIPQPGPGSGELPPFPVSPWIGWHP